MFWKKELKNTPYFMFSLGVADNKKCISLSVENELLSGNWYDSEGEHHYYCNVPVTEEFWTALYDAAEQTELFNWKAHKLFNRFASEINLEVFNCEGLFPNGNRFASDNMHGMPDDFEATFVALAEVFDAFCK